MAPTMSQSLKAAARKQKKLETENEGKEGESNSASKASEFKLAAALAAEKAAAMTEAAKNKGARKQPALKKTAAMKKPRKRVAAEPKELDVSVTIVVGSDDIAAELLKKMEESIEKECIARLCSIERGGALSRLHMQMICRILASSAQMVSKRIKAHLGWDKRENAPVGHHILSKTLRNTGLHTFIGMLGYCIKDKGEDHFECVYRNISPKQIAEGVEEYVKYSVPFAKNRVILTHKNLIERAATYCRYKMKKQLGSTLPGTLLPMLRSGQYMPLASWVLPVRQGGMEYTRASALWRCVMNPDDVTMDDVTQIFFEHTNPGSRLADLGRQRLAAHLNDAREGAPSDYVLPDTVLGDTVREQNNVIIIDGSQGATVPDLPESSTDAGLRSLVEPMFIPVVYGDRDFANSFLL